MNTSVLTDENRQAQLGVQAFNAIRTAAGENPVHSKVVSDIGAIAAYQALNTPQGHRISVHVSGTPGFTRFAFLKATTVLEFCIDVSNDRVEAIHDFAIGGKEVGKLSDLDQILKRACEHVRTWTMGRNDNRPRLAAASP